MTKRSSAMFGLLLIFLGITDIFLSCIFACIWFGDGKRPFMAFIHRKYWYSAGVGSIPGSSASRVGCIVYSWRADCGCERYVAVSQHHRLVGHVAIFVAVGHHWGCAWFCGRRCLDSDRLVLDSSDDYWHQRLVFLFCAVTDLWEVWAAIWPVELLSIGFSLLLVNVWVRSKGMFTAGIILSVMAGFGFALMALVLTGWVSVIAAFVLIGTGVLLLGRNALPELGGGDATEAKAN